MQYSVVSELHTRTGFSSYHVSLLFSGPAESPCDTTQAVVHTNMVYLLNFNITYIIILATCFDSYESSSGINFKELLYILCYSFYVLQFFLS